MPSPVIRGTLEAAGVLFWGASSILVMANPDAWWAFLLFLASAALIAYLLYTWEAPGE